MLLQSHKCKIEGKIEGKIDGTLKNKAELLDLYLVILLKSLASVHHHQWEE